MAGKKHGNARLLARVDESPPAGKGGEIGRQHGVVRGEHPPDPCWSTAQDVPDEIRLP